MHHCMLSPVPGWLAAPERYFLEKLPPALLATRWMGEFVSNIYEGTRRNNDMYIIWASARAPRERRLTAAFVNAAQVGRP